MPYGDPPPCPWNDAIGYMPWLIYPGHLGPLGKEFECALFDNLWELYAHDKSALWFWAYT